MLRRDEDDHQWVHSQRLPFLAVGWEIMVRSHHQHQSCSNALKAFEANGEDLRGQHCSLCQQHALDKMRTQPITSFNSRTTCNWP